MKSGIYICIASILLTVGLSCAVSAGTLLDDPLDGSTLGTPSGIDWGTGLAGQAAVFSANSADHIRYDASLFAPSGTFAFYVKGQDDAGWDRLFDTVGGNSPTVGDLALTILPGSTLRLQVYGNGIWNRLEGTTPISPNEWTYVAVSYGASNGMNLYINGVAEGTIAQGSNYAGVRSATDVYAGDVPGDSGNYVNNSFTGSIDMLRASDIENDINLLTAPAAVPEPTSLAVLASGLMCSIAALRRKRK